MLETIYTTGDPRDLAFKYTGANLRWPHVVVAEGTGSAAAAWRTPEPAVCCRANPIGARRLTRALLLTDEQHTALWCKIGLIV